MGDIRIRDAVIEVVVGNDDPSGMVFVITLYKEDNTLSLWGRNLQGDLSNSRLDIPDWLADGICELAKNKIEQESNRGA